MFFFEGFSCKLQFLIKKRKKLSADPHLLEKNEGTGSKSISMNIRQIPQSTELTSGPPELVPHFVSRASSHWRKSASCPKFDMVWLNRSPIPVGGGG